jgi:hypothetical protein
VAKSNSPDRRGSPQELSCYDLLREHAREVVVAKEIRVQCRTCLSLWAEVSRSSDRLLFARHAFTAAISSVEAASLEEHADEIEGATKEWSQAESALLIHWVEHRGVTGTL